MLAEVQAEVAGRPAGTAFVLLLDFDGTLAEFNPDPAAPELTPERWELLNTIGRAPGVSLGIVSGRRLDDLRARTRLPDHVYHAGLHGLEIEVDGDRTTHPDLPAAEARVEGLAACLRRLLDEFPGGDTSRTRAPASRCTRDRFRTRCTTVSSRAPMCWPCRGSPKDTCAAWKATPSSSTCRTSAVTRARRRSGSLASVEEKLARRAWVAYIGDDITDEDAFRAIDFGIGVLVGLRPTAATYKLDGIADVDRFLRWFAAEGNV